MRASALLRLFPRAWRVRYGEEFLAVAGDAPLGARQLLDILACAIDAWTSAEVRAAARSHSPVAASADPVMTKRMLSCCASNAAAPTVRDALYAALAMIGAALLFALATFAAKRGGYADASRAIALTAFPASLLFTLPFTYLKRRSWRVQLAFVGLPLVLLLVIGYFAEVL